MLKMLKRFKKPPIGLMPRNIHRAKRFDDIIDATNRFKAAGLDVPKRWVDEAGELASDSNAMQAWQESDG